MKILLAVLAVVLLQGVDVKGQANPFGTVTRGFQTARNTLGAAVQPVTGQNPLQQFRGLGNAFGSGIPLPSFGGGSNPLPGLGALPVVGGGRGLPFLR